LALVNEREKSRPVDRLAKLTLFASLWLTFAYFVQQLPGDNVNTRLALTYAIVERDTVAIDAYHADPLTRTGDKAVYEGHYYCDKSPALSFLATPLYWGMWQLRAESPYLRHLYDEHRAAWVFWTRYLLRIATVGSSAAILGIILWATARLLGASSGIAALSSGAILLGTILFGYATLFYAYLPSACCCMASYYLLLRGRLRDAAGDPRSSAITTGWILFWAGLLLGLAWFLEYTAGLAGLGVASYALWAARKRPRAIWKFVAGGLLPVIVFYVYTHHVFGQWGKIPYEYEFNPFFRAQMQQGFQGIHWPRLSVLYYLTIHPFRGLFFWSPFLLLAFAGIWRGLPQRAARRSKAARRANETVFIPDLFLALYVIVAYFVFNSGYFMWWGGYAAGPRLLCPALPFFLPPLVLWLRHTGKLGGAVFGVLLAISIQTNLAITATDPQVAPGIDWRIVFNTRISDNLPSPILNNSLPRFWRGDLAPNLTSEVLRLRGWGEARAHGLLTLIPLLLLWSAAAFLLGWRRSVEARPSPQRSGSRRAKRRQ